MNEVTKIHLGRQVFTISAEAHHELKSYLAAIERQVKDKSVTDEVELRMAELLTEHGIDADKVVLESDVDFLKEQLGSPKDFKEDEEEFVSDKTPGSKRFFRDTDNAMVAGVASGLSAYFGIDVLLIRILFVVGTIAWGGGILLYLLLWLLVPEAKTSSDRLQMAGKAVTVGSLKEVVERADVKGAAGRVNRSLAGPVNTAFSLIVKIIGIGLTVIGLSLLISLLTGAVYIAVHGNIILDNIFPIGYKEHLLVYIAAAVSALVCIFIILFGMAVYKRKWPVSLWVTGLLVGLTLIGIAASSALAADAAPRVRDRYNSHFQTIVKNVQPFSNVNINGPANVTSQFSDKYYVTIKYYDKSDPTSIKVNVKNSTLFIDTQGYVWDRHCSSLCLPNRFDLDVTIYSPNPPSQVKPYTNMPMLPAEPEPSTQ